MIVMRSNDWYVSHHEDGTTHSMPLDDTYLHTASRNCPCCPEVEEDGMTDNIVHFAFDERDKFERNERKPS